MMSTGSKRRKVTVDIKPQNKFDRGSVFERLGGQSREKQKKYKESSEVKVKPKNQSQKLIDGGHVAKPIKISRTSGVESVSKKGRDTEGIKYKHSDEKEQQPVKAQKRSGNHKSRFSPGSDKTSSKHKGDEISTSRIRKMDNLIIEKRVSPSSSSVERSRSSSPGSLRSRKKQKKHVSKHELEEAEYERTEHRSKSPEPGSKKRGKERGRSREPKKKHEKAHRKASDEGDVVYEEYSPEKTKHASQKKKTPKYDRHEKSDKKSASLTERKMKMKSKKVEEWDEDMERPCSQGDSGDEPLRESEHQKSNKKESKKHLSRELKRVGNTLNEEPLKTKRRKYEDVSPITSPSHSKKLSRVTLTDDASVREKHAQEGKKTSVSKSSSKKKHKDENLVSKKKQKDNSLQRTYSDFSSSSKYSQVEYSEHSDYIEERFSDEVSPKEKRKKLKPKKKKKEKDYEVYTTTDKSGYENEDIEADPERSTRKPTKKRKHKRESRSLSMSGSESERPKRKHDASGDIRIDDKRKKDAYAHAGESKMALDKRYRHHEVENQSPSKRTARDVRSKETGKLLTPPRRSHRGDVRLEGIAREDPFQERSHSTRDGASAEHSPRDYDMTKRSRLPESSPKHAHRVLSPRRSFERDIYREQSRKDLSGGRSRREDVSSKLSYRNSREGTSPRHRDEINTKEPYRDSVPLRLRDNSPGRTRREDISAQRRDRERISPVHQLKHSHTASRNSDVLVEGRDFLHEVHDTKRKGSGHLSKHASNDTRYPSEGKDYTRRNRGHHSAERPRDREWEAAQSSHQETGHHRETTRLLPDHKYEATRMQSEKYVPQRKLKQQSDVLTPTETYQTKTSWERKADRRPTASVSRRVPSLMERGFQKPEFSQSSDRLKSGNARGKYLDADRGKFQQDRKFQDKSWADTAVRTDQDHQYLISPENKNRRMRSGSHDSRSSSQHSRDVGRIRTFEAGPRDSSPRNSRSVAIEYNKPDRSDSRGRSHAIGKRADAIQSTSLRIGQESGESVEHRSKGYRKKVTHPSRGRSLEKHAANSSHHGFKSQKILLKHHTTGSLKGRSSSSSRSSLSQDHIARKNDVSPRRDGGKQRRKTREDATKASTKQGQKRSSSNQRSRERKKTDAITEGELTMLIDQNGESKASSPEAAVAEVDWAVLPSTDKPVSAGDVKEPSSVLKQFTPENILRTTGIATELLSQSMLKKLNQVYQQNNDSQCADGVQPLIGNIIGASLHSYADVRLRRRLLGHNLRYRHRLVPPAVINAKTYSACMKNYLTTCKVAV